MTKPLPASSRLYKLLVFLFGGSECQQNLKLIDNIESGGDLNELIAKIDPEKLKQSINISMRYGPRPYQAPLEVAAEVGNSEAIKILIDNGANINLVNKKNQIAVRNLNEYLQNISPSTSAQDPQLAAAQLRQENHLLSIIR